MYSFRTLVLAGRAPRLNGFIALKVRLLKDVIDQVPQNVALMGLDVGKKTIGVALSDPAQGLATPLETVKRKKFTLDVEAVLALAEDYEVAGYVIGYPVNMDGSEGPRAQSIRDFADEFQGRVGKDVFVALWDERLSTVSVEDIVDEMVEKRKTKIQAKGSGLIDKLAAQVILQGALDFIRTA